MAARGTKDSDVTRPIADTVVESEGSEPAPPAPTLDELAKPGSLLGRYAVLEEIGRGGMGLVLRAYDPKLQREVALKVVRVVSPEAEARLVREARAMAQLSHPNVVAIYDVVGGDSLPGGPGAASQVVLAMEYVAGVNFRQWCQIEERSPTEVIELLVEAGRGLAAAHREGLLHRDFKPDNVLVGHDGRVRVTDFGLARPAADSRSRDSQSDSEPGFVDFSNGDSQLTRAGTVLGSPRYMAPEQHRVGPLTPAADQFAFCVTLWEALQRDPPYDGKMEALLRGKLEGPPPWPKGVALPSRTVDAIRRGMNPTPAQRFATMDELLTALAGPRRSLKRWGVTGLVAVGGLTTVVWASRTDTAATSLCSGAEQQLAGIWDAPQRAAVERAFVDGDVAFAPAVWERIAPQMDAWVEGWISMHTDVCEATQVRHEQSEVVMDLRMACLHRARLRLEATSAVLAAAAPSTIEKAHDVVGDLPDLQRCADVEALQADVPPPGADEALAVAAIRGSLAEAAARGKAGDYDGAYTAVLNAEQASTVLDYEPVQTEVALELGRALDALGRYEDSEAALRRARLAAATRGQRDILRQATLKLIYVLGYRMARPAEAMAMREIALGLSGADPKAEASARSIVAVVLGRQGKYEEAEAEHRAVLALRREAFGEQHPDYAASRNNLGNILYDRGEYGAAETEYRAALAVRTEALGADHPNVAASRNNLGLVLQAQGRYEEAETEHRTAMAQRIAALGAHHPDVASSHNNLAMVLQMQGELEDAENEYRLAEAGWSDALGPEHPHVASVRHNLATVLSLTGRHVEAEAEERAVLAGRIEALGAEHPDVSATRHNLAIFLRAQGKLAEAEAEFRAVVAMRIEVLGSDHPEVAASLNNLGNVLHELGQLEEAETMHRDSLALRLRVHDADHPDIATSRQNLATVLEARGKTEEALAEFERALKQRRANLPAEHRDVAESALAVARILLQLERRADALELFREAYRIYAAGRDPAATARAAFDLAKALATDPAGFPEARSVGVQAVAAYVEAEDDEGKAAVEAWLRTGGT